MSLNHGPKINYNNLMVYLDAGNPKSYPGSGNTWHDIVTGKQIGRASCRERVSSPV